MIPLKDDVPNRSVPVITLLLIALNVLAFFYQAFQQGLRLAQLRFYPIETTAIGGAC